MDGDQMTQNQEPTSTLQTKSQNSPKKPNLAAKKMVGTTRKTRPRSRKQRIPNRGSQEHDEDDKAELVEEKIVALQRIVPGGEDLGVDKLFEETADYIMSLQNQVMAMRALTSFFEGLEKEKKTMLGGLK